MRSIAQRLALPTAVVLSALVLASCAGEAGGGADSTGLPMIPAAPARNTADSHARAPHVAIKEIAIPLSTSAIVPLQALGGIAVSPDTTVYVSVYMAPYNPYYDIPYIFVGLSYANGSWGPIINSTNASSFVGSGPATGPVAATRDAVAHIAGQHPYANGFGEAAITNAGPSAGVEFIPLEFDGVVPDLAGDSRGDLWYALNPVPLTVPPQFLATVVRAAHDGQQTSVKLSTDYRTLVEALAAAPNGDAWAATDLANSSAGKKLYHISAAGSIVHIYPMPRRTSIGGVAVAPNGTVWLTDSADNSIWKLSQRGTFSRYAIPTPKSGVDRITVGGDGALWFTENSADKIGRITTHGRIHEYAIPTPNAGPAGISSLRPGCSPNVIWFEEQSAGKIAEITLI